MTESRITITHRRLRVATVCIVCLALVGLAAIQQHGDVGVLQVCKKLSLTEKTLPGVIACQRRCEKLDRHVSI